MDIKAPDLGQAMQQEEFAKAKNRIRNIGEKNGMSEANMQIAEATALGQIVARDGRLL